MNVELFFEPIEMLFEELPHHFQGGVVLYRFTGESRVHGVEVGAFFRGCEKENEAIQYAKKNGMPYPYAVHIKRFDRTNCSFRRAEKMPISMAISIAKLDRRKYEENYGEEAAKSMRLATLQCGNGELFFFGTSIDGIPEEISSVRGVGVLPLEELIEIAQADKPRPTGLKLEIKEWLRKTSFSSFAKAVQKRVIGQEAVVQILAGVYNYMQCVSMGRKHNTNIILAAPSGTGKTETYRALKDYFKTRIPSLLVEQIDMSQVTEVGYKGADAMKIITEPLLHSEGKGVGIIFADEIDKKLVPSFSSSGTNYNLAAQANLLTLLEGMEVRKDGKTIDTSLTMFIGLGSFNEMRARKAKATHYAGFGAENTSGAAHYTPITREDMIELGGSYELIGRFSQVLNFHPLSEAQVEQVIKKLKTELSQQLQVGIRIDSTAMEELKSLTNSEYGCRSFMGYLQEAVMPAYAQWLLLTEAEQKKYRIALVGGKKAELRRKKGEENYERAEGSERSEGDKNAENERRTSAPRHQ